jgi:carbon storage regulator
MMLVLSRKTGQEIYIGDEIKVRVLSISGDTVRIGIDAPQDVTIMRKELLERYRYEEEES